MKYQRQMWFAAWTLAGCALLAGCHATDKQRTPVVEPTPTLTAAQTADLQLAFGRSLEKSGANDDAMALYQEALKKHPRSADILDRLAVLYDKKGQFEQALPLHKKALALQPNNADFHCNLGYCHYLQQRWQEAEAHFRKAIDMAPDHRRAWNNFGLVLAHTNRSRESLAAFQRGGCSEADAHSNLAFALTLDSSWKEAQAHYAHAQQLDPSSNVAAKGLQVINAQLEPREKVAAIPPAPPAPPSPPSPPAPAIENRPVMSLQFTEPAPMAPISPMPSAVNIDNRSPLAAPPQIQQVEFNGPLPPLGVPGAVEFETPPPPPAARMPGGR
jgi:tetratricopeptide (TPR) repeat protein